jgi:hypothetical protein
MTASAYYPQGEGQLKLPPLPPSSSDGDLGYLSNNSDGGAGTSHKSGLLAYVHKSEIIGAVRVCQHLPILPYKPVAFANTSEMLNVLFNLFDKTCWQNLFTNTCERLKFCLT